MVLFRTKQFAGFGSFPKPESVIFIFIFFRLWVELTSDFTEKINAPPHALASGRMVIKRIIRHAAKPTIKHSFLNSRLKMVAFAALLRARQYPNYIANRDTPRIVFRLVEFFRNAHCNSSEHGGLGICKPNILLARN